MNKEIKEKWVKALRSGKFPQSTMALKRVTEKGEGYCCLGVLCEVFRKETGKGEWVRSDMAERVDFLVEGHTETNFLPRAVMEWAGLSMSDPELEPSSQYVVEGDMTASMANDKVKLTFAEIADLVAKNL